MEIQSILELATSKAAEAAPLGGTIKFITEGGAIYMDGTGDENQVSDTDKDADCSIHLSQKDLGDLLSGELNPMMAFTTGKLKVKGDLGMAMKLASFV